MPLRAAKWQNLHGELDDPEEIFSFEFNILTTFPNSHVLA